jgi:hypothetical protein
MMHVKAILKAAATSLVLLSIAACTSVPITSYPKLASLDPETMDLADIELAVRMQDDFGIIEDSAVLSVSLQHKDTGEKIQERFILEMNDVPLTRVLNQKNKQGYVIKRFRMSPETAAAATAYRKQVVKLRNAEPGKQHEGTFGANVGFCMQPGGNPFLDPRMTLFIKTEPDEDFFTMIKETKVSLPRDQMKKAKLCEVTP